MGLYHATVEEIPRGARLTVTAADPADAKTVAKIRGLGFIGLLTLGAHHAEHHFALAAARRCRTGKAVSSRPCAFRYRCMIAFVDCVGRRQRRLRCQFGEDVRGQHLPELDAPLVEGVDVPDDALGEDGVLVEGDEGAEHARVSLSARIVVLGRLPSKTLWGTSPSGTPSAFTSCRRLAEGQRLGLGEHVGDQHLVVLASGGERSA